MSNPTPKVGMEAVSRYNNSGEPLAPDQNATPSKITARNTKATAKAANVCHTRGSGLPFRRIKCRANHSQPNAPIKDNAQASDISQKYESETIPLELRFEKNIIAARVIAAGREIASGPVMRRMVSFTTSAELLVRRYSAWPLPLEEQSHPLH